MQFPNATVGDRLVKPAKASLFPPVGTLILCLITLCVAVAQITPDGGGWSSAFGVIPVKLLDFSSLLSLADGQVVPQAVPVWLTLLTHVFPHGGWWHALPNMTALWVFGAIAEPVMGTRRFVLIYMASAVIGAFGNAIVFPSEKPAAGASLAISGVVGAWLAMRLLSKPLRPATMILVSLLELASISGVMLWLVRRTIPEEADLACSVMYHFIPFLAAWLGVRWADGLQRQLRKKDSPTVQGFPAHDHNAG